MSNPQSSRPTTRPPTAPRPGSTDPMGEVWAQIYENEARWTAEDMAREQPSGDWAKGAAECPTYNADSEGDQIWWEKAYNLHRVRGW